MSEAGDDGPAVPGRRRVLLLGTAAASAVVTVRPALAQTAGSVLHCQVPVPDPGRAGSYVAADGTVVAPGTEGAFPPAARPFTGEEVRRALGERQLLPGTDQELVLARLAELADAGLARRA